MFSLTPGSFAVTMSIRISFPTTVGSGFALLIASVSHDAAAQNDVQGQSVADRSRPEYEGEPRDLAGIALKARVTGGAEYNSNVLARSDLILSDFVITIEPEVKATLDRGLLRVTADLETYHARYLTVSTENTDDVSIWARATYGDTTDTRLDAYAEYTQRSENRSRIDSLSDVSVRGRYQRINANAGIVQRFGFLTGQARADVLRINYLNVTDTDGRERDFSFRDFTTFTARGELGYSRSGSSNFFVAGEYRRREYDLSQQDPEFDPAARFDRSGNSARIDLGYARQITSLLSLRAQAGYLRYDFDDERLPGISSIVFDLSGLYNITPLTTIQGTFRRGVDETVAPDLAGVTRTSLEFRADHELLRNLILSAQADYSSLTPIGTGRATDEYGIGIAATYLFSPRFRFGAFARQRGRNGANPLRTYDVASLGVTATYVP